MDVKQIQTPKELSEFLVRLGKEKKPFMVLEADTKDQLEEYNLLLSSSEVINAVEQLVKLCKYTYGFYVSGCSLVPNSINQNNYSVQDTCFECNTTGDISEAMEKLLVEYWKLKNHVEIKKEEKNKS